MNRPSPAPLLAALLAIAPSGAHWSCTSTDFKPDVLPNATVADVMIVTDPAVLDFGHVEVSTQAQRAVTISNQGTRDLVLQKLGLEGVGAFAIQPPANLTLAPGSSTQIDILYQPSGYEAASASLVIDSNDAVLPRATVGLAGRCDPPRIKLTPSIYDFGIAYLGCELEQPLSLQNLGDGPLRISKLAFDSSSQDLRISSSGLSFPLELAAGEALTVTAQYVPLDEGADQATLVIESNDPQTPRLEGTYLGEGRVAGLIRDRYFVDANGKVDILFVVDNSGSMGDNQANLTTNFTNFYAIIEQLNLDWQIGVITTDTGVLQGTYRIITPDTPNIQQVFKTNALVGTSGSGDEKGLEYAFQALSEPLVSSQNRGFLREDAGLHVIILSDEEDHSSRTVDFYVSYLQQLKVTPELVTLSAISGGASGCNTQGCGQAEAAHRYLQAVQATGGVQADICQCDFIEALEVLAEESQVIQDTFPLSQSPVPETLEVLVNGIAQTSSWTYDSALNAVVFVSPELTPQNGTQVEISYQLRLECSD